MEITLFRNENTLLVNTYMLSNDNVAFRLFPFTVKVKCPKKPKSVVLLPDGSSVDWEYVDGYVYIKTRDLYIFDMYKIQL